MAPLVLPVTLDRASRKSMPSPFSETSVNTGLAPVRRTVAPVATKVSTGTRTSSPGPTPRARRDASRAEVQLGKAIPEPAPQ